MRSRLRRQISEIEREVDANARGAQLLHEIEHDAAALARCSDAPGDYRVRVVYRGNDSHLGSEAALTYRVAR